MQFHREIWVISTLPHEATRLASPPSGLASPHGEARRASCQLSRRATRWNEVGGQINEAKWVRHRFHLPHIQLASSRLVAISAYRRRNNGSGRGCKRYRRYGMVRFGVAFLNCASETGAILDLVISIATVHTEVIDFMAFSLLLR